MGGYAAYVWSSYGVAVAVLAVLLISSVVGVRARDLELKSLEERVGSRRQRRQQPGLEDVRHDA
ncbi:heme exporter protein CcmD [Nisaea sp.]|uniref:heme exporter protein CcmD n=1 Tax=Nisaea sp. TaxID=2024842 RepID=UPI0032653D8E